MCLDERRRRNIKTCCVSLEMAVADMMYFFFLLRGSCVYVFLCFSEKGFVFLFLLFFCVLFFFFWFRFKKSCEKNEFTGICKRMEIKLKLK